VNDVDPIEFGRDLMLDPLFAAGYRLGVFVFFFDPLSSGHSAGYLFVCWCFAFFQEAVSRRGNVSVCRTLHFSVNLSLYFLINLLVPSSPFLSGSGNL